jgi:CrcB protein
MNPTSLFLVGIGGFFGAIARHVAGTVIAGRFGAEWPYATFLINVTGCFLIGFFVTVTTERVTVHEGWRFLFPIGFVGAYTTFSTYAYETVRLVEGGAWGRAVGYVAASTLAGYGAVVLALFAARRF